MEYGFRQTSFQHERKKKTNVCRNSSLKTTKSAYRLKTLTPRGWIWLGSYTADTRLAVPLAWVHATSLAKSPRHQVRVCDIFTINLKCAMSGRAESSASSVLNGMDWYGSPLEARARITHHGLGGMIQIVTQSNGRLLTSVHGKGEGGSKTKQGMVDVVCGRPQLGCNADLIK